MHSFRTTLSFLMLSASCGLIAQMGPDGIHIQAESFSDNGGVSTEASSDDGTDNVGWINDGDYCGYEAIVLSSQDTFEVRVASPHAGGKIQVRLDSHTGALLGECMVPDTGGFQEWVTVSCALSQVQGIRDVYLVFKGAEGYLFNVNWFKVSDEVLEGPDRFSFEPEEYSQGLRNPLKGFRPDTQSWDFDDEYAAITRCYIKWNELEDDESDTIQKIKDFCDVRWAGVEENDIKVIPRVYLDWDEEGGNEYWPADMVVGDYSSEQFEQRLVRLISRLGECWDNDPRVAWVQLGIIGYWGEHHSPSPTAEIQTLMGDAIASAFTNKKVLVRHPDEFLDTEVGIYWDSWAHAWQTTSESHGAGIEILNNATGRWKTHPIEGEAAYNWGDYQIQPGDDPDDTLTDPVHLDFFIDTIRNLHCTGLGWVANYSQGSEAVRAGASEMQKAFGYRFLISEFSSPRRVESDAQLDLSFAVVNAGSAPFYYDWPVEFSLLDPETRFPVWKTTLDSVDIRQWLPGDNWDEVNDLYVLPPATYHIDVSIQLPGGARLPDGEYIVALSVLEPLGLKPSVRFAITNYFDDGRHPFGLVGVGVDVAGAPLLDPAAFDDLGVAPRLPYARQAPVAPTPAVITDVGLSDGQIHIRAQGSNLDEIRVIQRSFDLKRWEAVGIQQGLGVMFEWMDALHDVAFFRVLTE